MRCLDRADALAIDDNLVANGSQEKARPRPDRELGLSPLDDPFATAMERYPVAVLRVRKAIAEIVLKLTFIVSLTV